MDLVLRWQENIIEEENIHGNSKFAKLVRAKFVFTCAILKLNINVIYSDVDIAILRNVFQLLADTNTPTYKNNDLLFLSDSHINEKYIDIPFQYLCTGFYWAKSSKKTIDVFEEMLDVLDTVIILRWLYIGFLSVYYNSSLMETILFACILFAHANMFY